MESTKSFDNYPVWMVLVSNSVSLVLYLSGLYIMSEIGLWASGLYLLYILIMEYRLLRYHCVNCYYYGKTCGFGQGRLSALFFKKGDPAAFCSGKMEWKDMIPDILVSLIPFITGIILLILDFNIILLAVLLLLVFLTTSGNAFVRGKLVCRFCRQREHGCPAEELFKKIR